MRLDEFAGVNAGYVLELYERYRQNPESVDPQTRKAFESWTPPDEPSATVERQNAGTATSRRSSAPRTWRSASAATGISPRTSIRLAPNRSAIRRSLPRRTASPTTICERCPASLVGGPVAESSASAFEAIEKLRRIYCSTTGFDYAHVFVPEEREWLRHAAESGRFLPPMDANSVEARARSHHPGRGVRAISAPDVSRQDALLDRGARHARADPRRNHLRRGRARRAARACSAWRTAAASTCSRTSSISRTRRSSRSSRIRSPHDSLRTDLGWMGDVKYHAGARTAAPRGQMYITMPPNPSHLEAVDPVAVGMARAAGTGCRVDPAPRDSTATSRCRF